MSGVPNTLLDLNDHLFAALERLDNEELTGDELKAEIERSKAVAEIGRAVVDNANTVLTAARFQENRLSDGELPRLLGAGA